MAGKKRELTVPERERIINLWKDGLSQRKIGKLVDKSRATVQSVMRKYKTEGIITNKTRQGRPRKLTEREERQILREVTKNPKLSVAQLHADIKEKCRIDVSASTVRRTIHRGGFKGRIARKKPWINATNRKKRLDFAKKYVNMSPDYWEKVIFSDECKVCVFDTAGSQRVWRKPGQEFQKENINPTVKHGGGSVMIWGCMAAAGVGNFCFVEGTMDRWQYLRILQQNVQTSADKLGIAEGYYLQHDNDPKHTAKIVKEWLLYGVPHVLNTPPQSPDVNPIEHLWAELKRNLGKTPIRNVEHLKERITEEWNSIPSTVTSKLVHSMPKRLQAILKAKGYPTKY